jgi:hypothetical protein
MGRACIESVRESLIDSGGVFQSSAKGGDLATCFAWKQVGLGFSNLASRLVEERLRVVHVASSWRSCVVEAEVRHVDVMGSIRPF